MPTREIHFMDNTGERYTVEPSLISLSVDREYSEHLTYLVLIGTKGKEYWYKKNNDHLHSISSVDTANVPEPLRLITLLEK